MPILRFRLPSALPCVRASSGGVGGVSIVRVMVVGPQRKATVSDFFPLRTATMRIEEPKAFRRFSLSLVEMALITGVLVRVYRSLVLTHGSSSFAYVVGTMAIALVFVIGMATAHLANYPLHHWVWRAPAFAALEVAGEMATSLFLIWLGREPNGTVRAQFDDWPSMTTRALLYRGLVVMLWSLVLAGIVHVVRTRFIKEEADDSIVDGE